MRLWKGNRLDAEHEMTPEEIVAGFVESEWMERDDLSVDSRLRMYIATEEGLNSAWDPAEQMGEYQPVLDLALARDEAKARRTAT